MTIFLLAVFLNRFVEMNLRVLCLFHFSEGEDIFPEDNINDIYHSLKYEADILFTR